MQACVSYLSAMILLFLDPQYQLAMTSPQGCRVPFISRSIWAYVSPLSVLRPGSVLENFSAQVENRTRAHGDESNPLEISISSAMKGKPGLATGLTTLGVLHPFICAWKSGHRNLCQARIEAGLGPHPLPSLLHTAPPVPDVFFSSSLQH
jgi:hypothetical protein